MAMSIRELYRAINCTIYDVVFYNDSILTTVTDDPSRVGNWISEVRSPTFGLLVGLDVEWHPSYSSNRNPVAVLQLCVGSRCLVFQICHSRSIPPSLVRFLSDSSNTFVGKDVKEDLVKLQLDYGIGGSASYLDLGELAAECEGYDLRYAGLKTLAIEVLGKHMEKPRAVTMSRWDNEWLTAEQVQYACLDAFLSYEIGRVLGA